MDMNQLTLIGNVGQDPEVKALASGDQIANFSVATTRKWKNKAGDQQEATQWHRCVVYDKQLVEVTKRFVQKGTRVVIQGAVETRSYQKDGATVYTTEVVLRPFSSSLSIEARGKGREDDHSQPAPAGVDDDIPF